MIAGLQRYLRIISFVDILLFFAVVIASAITENCVCNLKPFAIPYLFNETEEFQPQQTIWDYRTSLLEDIHDHGKEAYHIVYLGLWVILVSYIVVEIWLYCVLTKAISQKRITFCQKWIVWRFLLLAITISGCAFDISLRQLTCTSAIVLPFIIFRIISTLIVYKFSTIIKSGSSTDTIVMTGSEKL